MPLLVLRAAVDAAAAVWVGADSKLLHAPTDDADGGLGGTGPVAAAADDDPRGSISRLRF